MNVMDGWMWRTLIATVDAMIGVLNTSVAIRIMRRIKDKGVLQSTQDQLKVLVLNSTSKLQYRYHII